MNREDFLEYKDSEIDLARDDAEPRHLNCNECLLFGYSANCEFCSVDTGCTYADHDELRADRERFMRETLPGYTWDDGTEVLEMRHCRRCGSTLAAPAQEGRAA
jgi:hypothetical protein